jgi:hypothetical protein
VSITAVNVESEYGLLAALPFARALESNQVFWEDALVLMGNQASHEHFAVQLSPILHELRRAAAAHADDTAREAGVLYVLGAIAHDNPNWDTGVRLFANYIDPDENRPVFTMHFAAKDALALFARKEDGWRFARTLCPLLPKSTEVSEALVKSTLAGVSSDAASLRDAARVADCLCDHHDSKGRAELAAFISQRGAADPLSSERELALSLRNRCEP